MLKPTLLLLLFLLTLVSIHAETYFYAGHTTIATKNDAGISFHYSDVLRTTRVIYKEDGSFTTYTHLPFGQALSERPDRFYFTGKEEDQGGLVYFGARYYNPDTGAFSSIDPVPSEPPYTYVYNKPLTHIDPDGRKTWTATFLQPLEAQRFFSNGDVFIEARVRFVLPGGDTTEYIYPQQGPNLLVQENPSVAGPQGASFTLSAPAGIGVQAQLRALYFSYGGILQATGWSEPSAVFTESSASLASSLERLTPGSLEHQALSAFIALNEGRSPNKYSLDPMSQTLIYTEDQKPDIPSTTDSRLPYPNPTGGIVNIPHKAGLTGVSVYDLKGRRAISQQFFPEITEAGVYKYDFSNKVSSGRYYFGLNYGDGSTEISAITLIK